MSWSKLEVLAKIATYHGRNDELDGDDLHLKLLAGSFPTAPARVEAHAEARSAAFVNVRLIGSDGKEIVENKGPTEDQIALELARKNEPLRRALLIFGAKPHDWPNLHNGLEAMEDGNGGEAGWIAKQFVPPGQIKDFKATANSFPALGLESRHRTTASGIPEPKMTLEEAEEMFRKLFQGWIQELKASRNS